MFIRKGQGKVSLPSSLSDLEDLLMLAEIVIRANIYLTFYTVPHFLHSSTCSMCLATSICLAGLSTRSYACLILHLHSYMNYNVLSTLILHSSYNLPNIFSLIQSRSHSAIVSYSSSILFTDRLRMSDIQIQKLDNRTKLKYSVYKTSTRYHALVISVKMQGI